MVHQRKQRSGYKDSPPYVGEDKCALRDELILIHIVFHQAMRETFESRCMSVAFCLRESVVEERLTKWHGDRPAQTLAHDGLDVRKRSPVIVVREATPARQSVDLRLRFLQDGWILHHGEDEVTHYHKSLRINQ